MARQRATSSEACVPKCGNAARYKTDKKKAINLHLLFSAEDPKHEEHIARLLSRLRFKVVDRDYACTRSELIELDRHFDPAQQNDEGAFREGANQFKASFEQLLELASQDKCLIAVAGSNNDGTGGTRRKPALIPCSIIFACRATI